MKFGEQLNTHLTPEWRKQYIGYKLLKKLLYDTLLEAPPAADDDEGQKRSRYFAKTNEEFFDKSNMELIKINLFFSQKLAAAEQKFNELKAEVENFKNQSSKSKSRSAKHKESSSRSAAAKLLRRLPEDVQEQEQNASREAKTAQQLKLAFSEFYLGLVLLQNYQQLNATGFRKILKKHDKLWETSTGLEWRQNRVEKAEFYTDKKIETLIANTELIVITDLEEGNRASAMKRLRVPPLSEKQHAWTTFRLGLYLGCFLVLVFLICVTLLTEESRPREPKYLAVRLFRGFLVLFANIWLMGLNMYGWQEAGVNHVLIFEINPREHLTYQSLMEIASFFCMIWALCVLGYLHVGEGVPPLIFPLILMGFCVLWVANPVRNPFEMMFRSSRYWFARHIFYCFTAPFHFVTFPDFWLADQMNSLVTFFLDMEYFVCFYATEVDYSNWTMTVIERVNQTDTGGIDFATGNDLCSSDPYGIRAIVSILPALIRFLQCLRRFRDTKARNPHLINAGKYSTSFFVVAFGFLFNKYGQGADVTQPYLNPFFYTWVLAYIFSFAYTFMWDVWMDWGLLDPNAPESNRFLREELVYGSRWYYYFAVAQDFVLRLSWVANVSQGGAARVEKDVLMSVTAPFEIFRRFIWNYFRLENEHVNNCGQFRAVRDISIKPISKSDLDQEIHRMDDPHGVTHRGADLKGKSRRRKTTVKSLMKRKFSTALRYNPKSNNRIVEMAEISTSTAHEPDD